MTIINLMQNLKINLNQYLKKQARKINRSKMRLIMMISLKMKRKSRSMTNLNNNNKLTKRKKKSMKIKPTKEEPLTPKNYQ